MKQIEFAIVDIHFIAFALEIVDPYLARSSSKEGLLLGDSFGILEMPANDGGVDVVEEVIAYCAPLTVCKDLHAPGMDIGSVNKAQLQQFLWVGTRGKRV